MPSRLIDRLKGKLVSPTSNKQQQQQQQQDIQDHKDPISFHSNPPTSPPSDPIRSDATVSLARCPYHQLLQGFPNSNNNSNSNNSNQSGIRIRIVKRGKKRAPSKQTVCHKVSQQVIQQKPSSSNHSKPKSSASSSASSYLLLLLLLIPESKTFTSSPRHPPPGHRPSNRSFS